MDELVELYEKPVADEIYMLAGWHQWADAGAISSGLPEYLVGEYDARKIGEIHPDNFYLFQIPGTHHFLRPEIKLEEGHRQSLSANKNELFYVGDERKGLVVFLGTEPHLNIDRYAAAFFDAAAQLGVKRTIAVGGVYGAMPYDLDRDVSCVYSLKRMKEELANYSVKFSNYEGGATIGSYLLDRAEQMKMEFLAMYAFVPSYDFAEADAMAVQGIRLENDFRAWHEIMRRVNHMFGLGLNLADLERLGGELDSSVAEKIDELERTMPELNIREYVRELGREFEERPFMPLDDIWEQELGDIFGDDDPTAGE